MYMRMNPILPAADVIRSATLYKTTTQTAPVVYPRRRPQNRALMPCICTFSSPITPLVELSSSGKWDRAFFLPFFSLLFTSLLVPSYPQYVE